MRKVRDATVRITLVAILILVVGIIIGAVGNRVLNAQPASVKSTVLLKHDITGFEGKEGSIVEAITPPGAESGWHHHPGEEFIYLAEGTGIYETKGQTSQAVKPCDILYNDVGVVHRRKNTGTAPLRVIGFLVLEKGKPLAIPDLTPP